MDTNVEQLRGYTKPDRNDDRSWPRRPGHDRRELRSSGRHLRLAGSDRTGVAGAGTTVQERLSFYDLATHGWDGESEVEMDERPFLVLLICAAPVIILVVIAVVMIAN